VTRSELSWAGRFTALGQALTRRTSASGTQFPLQLLCWLRLRPAAAALPGEEFEGFVDELCVVLEDAAVAGAGVGDQLAVGQAAGQVG
jgi:hypothetical protein